MSETSAPLLQMEGIRKSFVGVEVLHGVDLDLHVGEVHAVVGENGAGKSTLMNILYGLYQPDEGEILVNGKQVAIRGPKPAGETYITDPPPPLYTTPGTAILSQLAVHPDCRGTGLGERLIAAAEAWAAAQGFSQIALDTAEPAVALRRRYERRGYVAVGSVQWQGKTYASVLMAKPIAAA